MLKTIKTVADSVKHTFALSGAPIKAKKGWFLPQDCTAKWVTRKQIDSINLHVKPNAKPVQCVLENHSKKEPVPFACYRINDLVEASALEKAVAHRHISASTGNPYRAIALYTLIKATLDRNFTSGLWVTKNRLRKQGINIKPNEGPTVISLPNDKKLELYNADQTTDRAKVIDTRAMEDKIPISAKTGLEFHGELRDILTRAAEGSPGFNSIWLTRKQAGIIGVSVRSEESPVIIPINGNNIPFFNATQTTAVHRVVAHVKQMRAQGKKEGGRGSSS